jgi:hypothetical protein
MIRTLIALALAGASLLAPAAQAAQRTFVATTGSDANTATNCGPTTPCRGFTAALSVTDTNGEIVVLNSGGYGPVTIGKSVSIISSPGVFAGVTVSSGSGIEVVYPADKVVLRGLVLNGAGGSYGIQMQTDGELLVEDCHVSGFATYGIEATGTIRLRVVDSLLRNNNYGILMQYGVRAEITGTRLFGNNYGIYAQALGATDISVSISDVVIGGGTAGIVSYGGTASATARVDVVRSHISNAANGLLASGPTGMARLTISESMVTGNAYGLFNAAPGTSVLQSRQNNTVTDNGTNTFGVITPLAGS